MATVFETLAGTNAIRTNEFFFRVRLAVRPEGCRAFVDKGDEFRLVYDPQDGTNGVILDIAKSFSDARITDWTTHRLEVSAVGDVTDPFGDVDE